MKNVTLGLLLFLAAAPLAAQETQITAWIGQADMQGENEFEDGLTTEFDDGFAMGVSVNRFVGSHLSIEASIFDIRSDSSLLFGDLPISLGDANLTPVLFGGQFHLLGQSRFDPYVGAGVAYVMARDLSSPDLEAAGLGRIELEDEIGYYLNAGIGIQVAGGLGIVADGRYIPYETESRSTVTEVERDLELTPLVLSLGLRFRF